MHQRRRKGQVNRRTISIVYQRNDTEKRESGREGRVSPGERVLRKVRQGESARKLAGQTKTSPRAGMGPTGVRSVISSRSGRPVEGQAVRVVCAAALPVSALCAVSSAD